MKMLYGTAKAVHVSGSGANPELESLEAIFVTVNGPEVTSFRVIWLTPDGDEKTDLYTWNGPCLITWAAPPEGALPL